MNPNLQVSGSKGVDGESASGMLRSRPDTCPLCGRGIDARQFGVAHFNPTNYQLEVVFRCPLGDCQELFIGYYEGMSDKTWLLARVLPRNPQKPSLPINIETVSPSFVEINKQAAWAEAEGWLLIAGTGYRKALEFLIKDYLIGKFPDKAHEVKGRPLGSCISDFVDDSRIREVAKRAAWLGNDETHYARKWEGKDLTDLKRLIGLTVNWIDMELETEAALRDMPDTRSQVS